LVSSAHRTTDHADIRLAADRGSDVIVVDHHAIPQIPAGAIAVLNPNRADCQYPINGLTAVGVA
jgi:single-stranded-DNA-specific exonuclease